MHHLPFEQFIAIELEGTFDGTSANFYVMSSSTLEKTKLTSFVAFERSTMCVNFLQKKTKSYKCQCYFSKQKKGAW
jgi:hypothetical protein